MIYKSKINNGNNNFTNSNNFRSPPTKFNSYVHPIFADVDWRSCSPLDMIVKCYSLLYYLKWVLTFQVHENAYLSDFHHCFSLPSNSSGEYVWICSYYFYEVHLFSYILLTIKLSSSIHVYIERHFNDWENVTFSIFTVLHLLASISVTCFYAV